MKDDMNEEDARKEMLDMNVEVDNTLSPAKKAMFAGEPDDIDFEEVEEVESDEEVTSDTGTETAQEKPADTETETGELDEEQQLLARYGLHKRFKSLDDVLASVPEHNKRNEELRQENYQIRQTLNQINERLAQQEQGPAEEVDNDTFIDLLSTNPQEAMRKLKLVDESQLIPVIQTLQSVVAENNWSKTVNSIATIDDPDAKEISKIMQTTGRFPSVGDNPLYDDMYQVYVSRPGLRNVPQNELMPLLYDLVRGNNPGKTKVEPVSATRKQRASTSKSKVTQAGIPNFNRMSAEEIRNWAAAHDLID